MEMRKCPYCHKDVNIEIDFCSSECETSHRNFINFRNNSTKTMSIIMAITILSMFLGILILNYNNLIGFIIICLSVFLLGIDLIIFPFIAPPIYDVLGVKPVVLVVRLVATIITIVTFAVFIFNIFITL